MQSIRLLHMLALVTGCVLVLPMLASAHERQAFQIGDTTYLMVVGSIGEPVVVDDKTGVQLRVFVADPDDIGNTSATASTPVAGLEETLSVVVSAADESREMALSPAYGQMGTYESLFFPTRATEFSYTFIGEIDGIPVELPFTCMPGDHVMHGSHEDTSAVALGENVTRVFQAGSFTCPREKESLGFPGESASLASLKMTAGAPAMEKWNEPYKHKGAKSEDHFVLGIALLALMISIYTFASRRGSDSSPRM